VTMTRGALSQRRCAATQSITVNHLWTGIATCFHDDLIRLHSRTALSTAMPMARGAVPDMMEVRRRTVSRGRRRSRLRTTVSSRLGTFH
jgi:hypothetical protein